MTEPVGSDRTSPPFPARAVSFPAEMEEPTNPGGGGGHGGGEQGWWSGVSSGGEGQGGGGHGVDAGSGVDDLEELWPSRNYWCFC
jgi:hypothetical protein